MAGDRDRCRCGDPARHIPFQIDLGRGDERWDACVRFRRGSPVLTWLRPRRKRRTD